MYITAKKEQQSIQQENNNQDKKITSIINQLKKPEESTRDGSPKK